MNIMLLQVPSHTSKKSSKTVNINCTHQTVACRQGNLGARVTLDFPLKVTLVAKDAANPGICVISVPAIPVLKDETGGEEFMTRRHS